MLKLKTTLFLLLACAFVYAQDSTEVKQPKESIYKPLRGSLYISPMGTGTFGWAYAAGADIQYKQLAVELEYIHQFYNADAIFIKEDVLCRGWHARVGYDFFPQDKFFLSAALGISFMNYDYAYGERGSQGLVILNEKQESFSGLSFQLRYVYYVKRNVGLNFQIYNDLNAKRQYYGLQAGFSIFFNQLK